MQKKYVFSDNEGEKNMGLKERRKKIMALMLAACVAGTSTVPVTASDISVFSDGTNAEPEVFDSSDVATAADTNNTLKDVRVIYVDATDRQIDTDTIQVPSSATSVSVIKGEFAAPKGYELVTVGDILIKDNGSLILKVKPAVKDIKVTYVDAESGDVVDNTTVKVSSDAKKVSVVKGKFDAPEGYELVTFGDFLIKNGGITLKVKASVKDVKVIYVNAKTETTVETSTVQVPCNATSVSVVKGKFYTPEGYELVTLGDLSIENNTLTVKVKAIPKKVGKTVKITYKLSKTKKVIATRKIVVDKKATSIKASSIPVPTGYKMVSSGNCSVRTRKITIYVTK